jgi:hypothetical protein
MKDIYQSFNDIVKGIETDHVAVFMISPAGETCILAHHGTGSDEKSCAKDLLRVAFHNFLSVFEGDDFNHGDAACCAESFFTEMLDEYKAEYET